MRTGRAVLMMLAIVAGAALGFAQDDPIPPFASPEYIEMFIQPETPYTHVCRCARPDCPGFSNPGFLVWSRERPNEIQCKACGTWYPNEEFPEDQFTEVDGRRYPYHEDAQGRPLFFSGNVRYAKLMRALYDARYAARDYAETGDPERGRQARDVLLAIARVYPGFFYARTPTFAPGLPVIPDVPGNAGAGRLKQYFGDYGMPSFFCDIWDPLAGSDLVTEEQRAQVRALIEDCVGTCVFPYFKLYRATGNTAGQMLTDFVRAGTSFPDLTVHDLVHEHHFGAERILRGPDLVHEAIEGSYGLANLFANGFYADGFWHEGSLSYQHMVLVGMLPALRMLRGYSDPADYVPADPAWRRLDDYQPLQSGRIGRALVSLPLLAFPDGTVLTLGDSHKGGEVAPGWVEALGDLAPAEGLSVPSESAFHDGIGVSALRCGGGPDATAAFLIYGPRGGGHSHYDQLNLTYYALGHELVTDIGYPDSTDPLRGRWWNRSAAHNTVVVDGRNQAQSMGRLELFATSARFRVAQASCSNAYPDLDDYRRTVVLVGAADEPGSPRYVVDVFHVVGGSTHDWAFHAQSEPDLPEAEFAAEGIDLADAGVASLLELTPGAEPDVMGYDCVTDLRRAIAGEPWSARWITPDEEGLELRLLALPEAAEEVFVGSAPGHRLPPKENVDIGKRMTWLCRRVQGEAPLSSVFASVIEALPADATAGVTARRLAVNAPPECSAVAIEVTHAGGRDVLVVARTADAIDVPEADMRLDGRIGLVSFDRDGAVTGALLLDGTALTAGHLALSADGPSPTGEVMALPEGITDAPLVIDVDLPLPPESAGRMLTLAHANHTGSAWAIARAEPLAGGGARLTLDRSACEGVGRVGRLSEGGTVVFANAGFRQLEEGLSALFYDGAWLSVGEGRVPVRAVAHHGRGEPWLHEATLAEPLSAEDVPEGAAFTISRVAVGDRVVVPNVIAWP